MVFQGGILGNQNGSVKNINDLDALTGYRRCFLSIGLQDTGDVPMELGQTLVTKPAVNTDDYCTVEFRINCVAISETPLSPAAIRKGIL